MTAQIPDTFNYLGEVFDLVGKDGGPLWDPVEFGFRPIMISTACYRGFHSSFEIEDARIYLKNFFVSTEDGIYPPIGANCGLYEKMNGCWVYRNLRLPIPFSGKLILANDFIEDRYVHFGFQRPSSYQTLYEMVFSAGSLDSLTQIQVQDAAD